jgi:hypothetical protein
MKMICRILLGLVLADESESAQWESPSGRRAEYSHLRFVTAIIRSLWWCLRLVVLWGWGSLRTQDQTQTLLQPVLLHDSACPGVAHRVQKQLNATTSSKETELTATLFSHLWAIK